MKEKKITSRRWAVLWPPTGRGGLLLTLVISLPLAALLAIQVAKLTALDGAATDQFGKAVGLGQDTIIVGANRATVDGQGSQGAAYIFQPESAENDTWTQLTKLTATDGAAGDEFGWAVALNEDGSRAVVGAHFADIGAHSRQGAAYIFERDQGGPQAWGQVTKLIATDGMEDDGFGRAVAISGDTVLIGAPGADVDGNVDQGAAYIFERDQAGPAAWGQVTKLTAADGAAEAEYGFAVGLNQNTLLVGAPSANVSNFSDGAAYIHARDQGGPGQWGQVTKLAAADGVAHNQFGWSAAIEGDTIVVGALRGDAASGDEGAAYVFERNQGGPQAWGQSAKLTAADGIVEDFFGTSVAVAGDGIVVGSWAAIIAGRPNQGAVYVFTRPGGWQQTAKLTAADGAGFDHLGESVAMEGEWVVAGAYLADVAGATDQGAAYMFKLASPQVYLPLVMKRFSPFSPSPTFPYAPQRLVDIPVGN